MPKNKKKSSKRKRSDKNNSYRQLFVKTFFISSGVFIILIFSSWILLRNWIKPPVIPAQPVQLVEVEHDDDWSGVAFMPPHSDEADKSVGGDLPAPERFMPSDRKDLFYTFLIVGLDNGINTDTIMVASYDGTTHTADILGIPRDSLVNVKRRVKKINSAYGAGTLDGGGREGGIDQLKRELKTIIGFIPDFCVMIDLKAFVKIVDAVNGVEIDVPFNMRYDDDTPGEELHVNIKQGLQTLNGENALKFARYRKGNSGYKTITDYERIANQQAVINAVLAKLLRPESLLKIPEFISIFNECVYTDIEAKNIPWFTKQLNEVEGINALKMHTMPTTGTSGPPRYYELLDKPAIVELVNNTINPYLKDIESKDLDILNYVPE